MCNKKFLCIKMSIGVLPLPATLNQIIPNLMNNYKTTDISNNDVFIAVTKLTLSDKQKSQLSYPDTMDVLDEYYLQQIFTEDVVSPYLLSFTRIRDFIFGVYFNVENFETFDLEKMVGSKNPLFLPDNVQFKSSFYIESYFNIDGLIILNGFNFETDNVYSSIQYMQDGKFYNGSINNNGIIESHFTRGTAYITGLSKNLNNKCNDNQRECSKGRSSYFPPPASLEQTLLQIFPNNKRISTQQNGGVFSYNWSRCLLSEEQKTQIVYPPGFTPLDFFVYFQFSNPDIPEATSLQLVSFAKKDGYLFGFYYDLDSKELLPIEKLISSKKSIKIDPNIKLIDANYIECYFKIKTCKCEKVIINGLSTLSGDISSSLQYSEKDKNYVSFMNSSGILPLHFIINSKYITGISKNLKLHKDC